MKAKPYQNQDGVALLVTILALSILVSLTVILQKSAWRNLFVSKSYMEHSRLRIACQSGINIGLAFLEQDAQTGKSDSLFDDWAKLKDEPFSQLYSDVTMKIEVRDKSGLLPINCLINSKSQEKADSMRRILSSLLKSDAFHIESENRVREIVNSLVDWLDADDRESDFGAEDSYYQSLPIPHHCKNGKIQSLDEMLLIKGIDRALLYGSQELPALADYITVYSEENPTININTAPLLLMESMLDQRRRDVIEKTDLFRRNPENQSDLEQIGWYKNIPGWNFAPYVDEGILSTKSYFFELTASAQSNTLTHKLKIIVERDGTKPISVLRRLSE